MSGGHPPVPPDEVALIVALLERGYNDQEVAYRVGRTRDTVWRVRRQRGMKPSGRAPLWKRLTQEELARRAQKLTDSKRRYWREQGVA